MDFQPKCREQIRLLIEKGVHIPNPLTLDIGPDVNIDRISGKDVTIFPGCRIYGAKTVISSGCRIGFEAPATIQDCQLGSSVELKGGFFSKSVFLEKSSMGLGGHVREGCLLEEQASGAHCVGLKQTILFPFVTLGSLINFCDCLMAGGTSRQNHSEVGSSYIHFNFTPDGDKATPSLIGDTPRGVMLNQPPIFLGGQGGMVGPLRIEYGNVVAAGSILRKDCLKNNQLIFGAGHARNISITRSSSYSEIKNIVEKNLLYLAHLKALAAWYIHIRKSFFGSGEFLSLIYEAAVDLLAQAGRERLSRLGQMAQKALDAVMENSEVVAERRELIAGMKTFEELFVQDHEDDKTQQARNTFLTNFANFKAANGNPYLQTIQQLSAEVAAEGVHWLDSLVNDYCRQASAAVPSLNLFKNVEGGK